jgi:hypothetical protein
LLFTTIGRTAPHPVRNGAPRKDGGRLLRFNSSRDTGRKRDEAQLRLQQLQLADSE